VEEEVDRRHGHLHDAMREAGERLSLKDRRTAEGGGQGGRHDAEEDRAAHLEGHQHGRDGDAADGESWPRGRKLAERHQCRRMGDDDPALTQPMIAKNRPIPAAVARLIDSGKALMIDSRTPAAATATAMRPERKTQPKATGHFTPCPSITPNVR